MSWIQSQIVCQLDTGEGKALWGKLGVFLGPDVLARDQPSGQQTGFVFHFRLQF